MIDIPRNKLRDVLAAEGLALCHNPRRCETLLRQECPQFPREVRVLIRAQELGLTAELLSAPLDTPWPEIERPLLRGLMDTAGYTEEEARWALHGWARALGLRPVA